MSSKKADEQRATEVLERRCNFCAAANLLAFRDSFAEHSSNTNFRAYVRKSEME